MPVNGVRGRRIAVEGQKSTAGKFREYYARFALKIEGVNRGVEGENPVTPDRPESLRLKSLGGEWKIRSSSERRKRDIEATTTTV